MNGMQAFLAFVVLILVLWELHDIKCVLREIAERMRK